MTEDMMPLLGMEAYREFGIPYLRRIAEGFGGVFIHCCGKWGRHAPTLADSDIPIRGVEFHHPFTAFFDELRDPLRGTLLVPFLAGFRDTDYPGFPAYVEALPVEVGPGDRIALVATDTEGGGAQELATIVRRAGGLVPSRVVAIGTASEAGRAINNALPIGAEGCSLRL